MTANYGAGTTQHAQDGSLDYSRHTHPNCGCGCGAEEAMEARIQELENALKSCRELFVELRGDWSDNRGPCREGFAIIDAALGGMG